MGKERKEKKRKKKQRKGEKENKENKIKMIGKRKGNIEEKEEGRRKGREGKR